MRSKQPADVLAWLEKVIDSCQTYQQTFPAMKCIQNFKNQNQFNAPEYLWQADRLRSKLNFKREQLLEQNLLQ